MAFLLGDATDFHCFGPSAYENDIQNAWVAAMVTGAVSIVWYLLIRFHARPNAAPRYPTSFLYLTGSSFGLFLFHILGSLL